MAWNSDSSMPSSSLHPRKPAERSRRLTRHFSWIPFENGSTSSRTIRREDRTGSFSVLLAYDPLVRVRLAARTSRVGVHDVAFGVESADVLVLLFAEGEDELEVVCLVCVGSSVTAL